MAKVYFTQGSHSLATVEIKYDGIGRMLTDKDFWPPLERIAEKMKAIAVASAPVAREGGHRGRYKKSFEVVRGQRVSPHPRVFARLQNDAPEALAVEYGTRATRRKGPAHRTLRKAARAVKGM